MDFFIGTIPVIFAIFELPGNTIEKLVKYCCSACITFTARTFDARTYDHNNVGRGVGYRGFIFHVTPSMGRIEKGLRLLRAPRNYAGKPVLLDTFLRHLQPLKRLLSWQEHPKLLKYS